MVADAVSRLPGQVQPLALLLQHLHHADTLLIVGEAALAQLVEHPLSRVSKRRMPQVMAQRNGFHQRFVHPERPGDRPGILGNLQRMGQPRAVVISHGRQKHLGLMLHPAKCLGMQDPVPVPLVHRANVARLLLPVPSSGSLTQRCIRT